MNVDGLSRSAQSKGDKTPMDSKAENCSRLEAQPAKLDEMVDYQKGSIVSRELISRKTGTVTLFAFDEGQGLSEHTAPFDAMVQILDGEAEITITGKPFHLKAGEMVIMPANKPHALKAAKRFKMILTMIRS
jgi:quercetin dioxygenase-like cupin family protein